LRIFCIRYDHFIFEIRLANNIIVISPIREYWLIPMQIPTLMLAYISSLEFKQYIASPSLNEWFIILQGLRNYALSINKIVVIYIQACHGIFRTSLSINWVYSCTSIRCPSRCRLISRFPKLILKHVRFILSDDLKRKFYSLLGI